MPQFIPRNYASAFFPGLALLLTMILMLSPTAVHSQSASAFIATFSPLLVRPAHKATAELRNIFHSRV
jgi:hypothetical protein